MSQSLTLDQADNDNTARAVVSRRFHWGGVVLVWFGFI